MDQITPPSKNKCIPFKLYLSNKKSTDAYVFKNNNDILFYFVKDNNIHVYKSNNDIRELYLKYKDKLKITSFAMSSFTLDLKNRLPLPDYVAKNIIDDIIKQTKNKKDYTSSNMCVDIILNNERASAGIYTFEDGNRYYRFVALNGKVYVLNKYFYKEDESIIKYIDNVASKMQEDRKWSNNIVGEARTAYNVKEFKLDYNSPDVIPLSPNDFSYDMLMKMVVEKGSTKETKFSKNNICLDIIINGKHARCVKLTRNNTDIYAVYVAEGNSTNITKRPTFLYLIINHVEIEKYINNVINILDKRNN